MQFTSMNLNTLTDILRLCVIECSRIYFSLTIQVKISILLGGIDNSSLTSCMYCALNETTSIIRTIDSFSSTMRSTICDTILIIVTVKCWLRATSGVCTIEGNGIRISCNKLILAEIAQNLSKYIVPLSIERICNMYVNLAKVSVIVREGVQCRLTT